MTFKNTLVLQAAFLTLFTVGAVYAQQAASPPAGQTTTAPLSKDELKAQKKQQKQEEKAANASAKAAKSQAKAKKAQDDAIQQQEKATPSTQH